MSFGKSGDEVPLLWMAGKPYMQGNGCLHVLLPPHVWKREIRARVAS